MRKPALLVVVALLVVAVFVAGYYTGRAKLESEWRLPPMVLSAAEVNRLKLPDADPVPPAGTRVVRAMPLERTRATVKAQTEKDPIRVTLGSVGRGDEGASLTVVVENGAPCEVASLEGVAYGFSADGRSARMNKGGEHFVAFAQADAKLAPKAKTPLSWPLKFPDTASVAVAQVDSYRCTDGTTWARAVN